MENWKDIPGFEGLYLASDQGRIKSYDKMVRTSECFTRLYKGRIKRLRLDSKGRYVLIDLRKDGVTKTRLVHRLVARTFKGNCDGLVVNHLNGNTQDNRADNLEITTQSENNKHSYRVLKNKHPSIGKKGKMSHRSVPVLKVDAKTGETIKEYESNRLTEEDGFISSSVSLCCNGKQKQHKGYVWKFKG